MIKPSGILKAVQEIDRHHMFLFENQENFFRHFNVTDNLKLETVEFRGAYLTITYTTLRDELRKHQFPIFDYASWRRHLGK
jgi:hypothetical protein